MTVLVLLALALAAFVLTGYWGEAVSDSQQAPPFDL